MAVKVLILRKLPKDLETTVEDYLNRLSLLASSHTGYISGETLVSADEINDLMIISTWQSIEDWKSFLDLAESRELHGMVDILLGAETVHRVYRDKFI